MAKKYSSWYVEWYSQENELIHVKIKARSWREALFIVCDHPKWLHDVDVVGLRVRSVYSKKWHYPKSIDDPIED